MSLTNGDKLGPYEIIAALGAGGMGEVHRASDIGTRDDARQCQENVLSRSNPPS